MNDRVCIGCGVSHGQQHENSCPEFAIYRPSNLLSAEKVLGVNELRSKRNELEENISSQVSKLVEEFKVNTGFSPTDIAITLIDISNISDPEPEYIVDNTEVYLKI